MFRLCVVGSGGVGKSSLTIRYLKNEFTEVGSHLSLSISLGMAVNKMNFKTSIRLCAIEKCAIEK